VNFAFWFLFFAVLGMNSFHDKIRDFKVISCFQSLRGAAERMFKEL
jgi:hypothetical protein